MIEYFDTSVLVASVAREARSAEAQARLMAAGDDATTSYWTLTEGMSALARKLRSKDLNQEDHAAAATLFDSLLDERMTLVPIRQVHFERAASLCRPPVLKIVAGDALHLAVAEAIGATVHTYDRDMHAAAVALGIAVVPLA